MVLIDELEFQISSLAKYGRMKFQLFAEHTVSGSNHYLQFKLKTTAAATGSSTPINNFGLLIQLQGPNYKSYSTRIESPSGEYPNLLNMEYTGEIISAYPYSDGHFKISNYGFSQGAGIAGAKNFNVKNLEFYPQESGFGISVPSSITVGSQSASIQVTKPSGAPTMYTSLSASINSSSVSIATNSTANTITWTPTTSTIAPMIPNALTATATINGTINIYQSFTRTNAYVDSSTPFCPTDTSYTRYWPAYAGTTTMTVNLQSSQVKPSVSGSLSDATGAYGTYGRYVVGLSKLSVAITASGQYNATIRAYSSSANGATYSSSSFTTGKLQSGYTSISITVTDSRGVTASYTISYNVVNPADIAVSINASTTPEQATVGSSNAVTINNTYGFKCTAQIIYSGSVKATILTKSTTQSTTWTPNIDNWGVSCPTSSTFTVTSRCIVYTADGATTLATKDKTVTMTIPSASLTPACSLAVSDYAGLASTYGGYVLGHSRIKADASYTLKYGATLSSIRITANGTNYSYNNCITGAIESTSYTSVSCTITDSRGNTATATATITIVNWFTPQITIAVHRGTYSGGTFTPNDNGGYVKIDWGITIAPVNNRNSKSGSVSAPDGNHSLTLSSYTASGAVISVASTESSYEITVTATDAFTTVSKSTQLSTAGVVMDIKSGGKGIAFGKVAETDNMMEISSTWTLKAYNVKIGNQTLAEYIRSVVGS